MQATIWLVCGSLLTGCLEVQLSSAAQTQSTTLPKDAKQGDAGGCRRSEQTNIAPPYLCMVGILGGVAMRQQQLQLEGCLCAHPTPGQQIHGTGNYSHW